MLCDVDAGEVSAVYMNDDESTEQVETDRRDDEEVRGGNLRRVVAQEGPAYLVGWLPSFHHVLGDARLRDLKPELDEFAVDARRAPKRIFDADPPDQHAQLTIDLRPAKLSRRVLKFRARFG
jgi:hypothetical protein